MMLSLPEMQFSITCDVRLRHEIHLRTLRHVNHCLYRCGRWSLQKNRLGTCFDGFDCHGC